MDPTLLTPILEAYSWTRVFERVEQVYFRALKPDRPLNLVIQCRRIHCP